MSEGGDREKEREREKMRASRCVRAVVCLCMSPRERSHEREIERDNRRSD